MLDEVTASNLGLITDAEVTLSKGLTVISGETGAGKTLMLGALRLLRGDKAGKGYIGPATDACDVSARFVDSDGVETVLRRRVDAARSRAYIDGAAATVGALADSAAGRIAIVGQHDQHTITSSSGVRALVDRGLSAEGAEAKAAYAAAWHTYSEVIAERDHMNTDARSLERERDMLDYQIEEIDEAALAESEDVDLAHRVAILRNADGLNVEIDLMLKLIGDSEAAGRLDAAIEAARRAVRLDAGIAGFTDRLETLATELSDLAGDIAVYASNLEADPADLEAVESRLAEIGALQRKYGDTVADIIAYADSARSKRLDLSGILERTETLEERLGAAAEAVGSTGTALRLSREAAATSLTEAALEHLNELGFEHPALEITVTEAKASRSGTDRVTVLFASDDSLTLAPVAEIASGGELSRLVLALTLAAGADEAAVLAFDEIDAGVGGTTALALGRKLAALAEHRQVICVTHLPQVAAFASTHYRVDRSGHEASIHRVEGDARLSEVTRMLSGLSESEKGRIHAEELLTLAQG